MKLQRLRHELSVRSKNGMAFLVAGVIIWLMITIIYLLPLEIAEQNVLMLFSTGFMFPLAVLFSKLIKADWKTENHPLGDVGLYLNIAQFIYFPLLFWVFMKSPHDLVLFFAVITGAHFFPYGWFYHVKAYYVMAPVISVGMMAMGWSLNRLWLLPTAMVIFLLILIGWLFLDYKKKASRLSDRHRKQR